MIRGCVRARCVKTEEEEDAEDERAKDGQEEARTIGKTVVATSGAHGGAADGYLTMLRRSRG